MAANGTSGPRAIAIDEAFLRACPLPDHAGGDKEERGRVLVVAGSREIPGAAVLAATAALRAGAGKVTIATPESIAHDVAFAVPESRVIALEETAGGGIAPIAGATFNAPDDVKAVLIGPGLPYERQTCELAAALLARFPDAGFILDAGAMKFVSTPPYKGTRFSGSVLLTPHAGEMASLTGRDKKAVAAEPERAALDAAQAWNALVALKGAITWVASPAGQSWRHEGGTIGLATSGSGDVLAGIIAGLVARGAALDRAAAWGIALHARAGCALAERLGPLGFLAREIAGEVPAIMAALARR